MIWTLLITLGIVAALVLVYALCVVAARADAELARLLDLKERR